jgi:hypothetical protein
MINFKQGFNLINVNCFDKYCCRLSVIMLYVSSSAASLTIILGYYGSVSLELGPNCSRLVQPNPLFVQSLKVIFFFGFLFDFSAAIIGSANLI